MPNYSVKQPKSWKSSFASFFHTRVISMFFLGFSAGIPSLIIFSSLSLWLREAGIDRSSVTFFSWASLGYSFKFVWAPLIDQLPVPWLTGALGRRRSWMLLSQIAVILSIVFMAMVNPAHGVYSINLMFFGAVSLGFFSATQDIVIDAYRIEAAVSELQAMMASAYVAGYRIAMILAGAGTLFLAEYLGSTKEIYSYAAWKTTYLVMAVTMLVGVVTTFLIHEPEQNLARKEQVHKNENIRLLALFLFSVTAFILVFHYSGNFAAKLEYLLKQYSWKNVPSGFIVEVLRLLISLAAAWYVSRALISFGLSRKETVDRTYVEPIRNFFTRYGMRLSLLILCLIGLYRISDTVLGVIANVFYQDLGFSKTEIAAASKTFGLVMTITGGFAGGVLSVRYGVMRVLFLGAFLSSATNLLFMFLAKYGYNVSMLYWVISVDSLAGGIATAAFIAFLSSLTDVSFTAMQYAVFSSLMTLIPKLAGGYSGIMVNSMGYPVFFLLTAVMGIPVLFLVWLAGKKLNLEQ